MAVWIITGELGSGKTLIAVSRIRDALERGCQVATNLDLRLEGLVSSRTRCEVTRLPDWPKASDLESLGVGYAGRYDESRFGVLVLDEAATFMNSREWGDQDRMRLIRWLLHARKLRWHVYLIVQDISMIDKQVRSGLAEHVVRCRRLDRYTVPGVSALTKMLGLGPVRLPQMHLGLVRYGTGPNAPLVEVWRIPFARDLHAAYDTGQKILGENDGAATMLDGSRAPWLWKPSGLFEIAWEAVLWRWWPASAARRRHDDFRAFTEGWLSYKPASSAESWASFARRIGPGCEPSAGERAASGASGGCASVA